MPALSKQFEFVINTGTNTATSVAIPSAATAPDGSLIFKSEPLKADGYYGSSDGIHTITYTVTPNFVGTLTTQATLTILPTDSDWFNITGTSYTYSAIVNPVLTTTTVYANALGNFTWCRAYVHRADIPTNGSVLNINFNY
jgi:hypothetical protein